MGAEISLTQNMVSVTSSFWLNVTQSSLLSTDDNLQVLKCCAPLKDWGRQHSWFFEWRTVCIQTKFENCPGKVFDYTFGYVLLHCSTVSMISISCSVSKRLQKYFCFTQILLNFFRNPLFDNLLGEDMTEGKYGNTIFWSNKNK